MFSFNQSRLLPAVAVCAALGAVSAALAQTQAQPPDPSSDPASRAELSLAGQQIQPTPEQVGDALMTHQRYQAAIQAYKMAPPDSPSVWNKMGIAHQMMFNLPDASRCYQASLRLNPANPRVLNNLGTVYDSLKEYGVAERMYRKAIKLNPKSALVYKNLGTALLAQHNYRKGWEAYQTALAIDPEIFKDRAAPKVENPGSVQERGAMNYYMARGCVRAGMNDCAIDHLRLALNEGFTNPKKIVADTEFAGLRGLPAFDQLLAAQGAQ